MPTSRQLAAILFTDIEGYTAMMQQDEQKAIAMRGRHREILQKEHKQFNGRIVQYYGDGTLSIFQSAIEAVKCAIAMQQSFRHWPAVPVRMGMHIGDVIFNEEHVFGDGVNLASRIESLSLPGCVLISDKVNDEMRNQPDLKTVSVGVYQLKNIDRPVEVFALNHEGLMVPAMNSLKGKTEAKNPPAEQGQKKLRLRHKSIAVFPFRNITNDSNIEWLSDGFTEELTSAIAGISDLKVKSSTAMKHYKNSTKSFDQIAGELHVANFIEGAVQKQGNDVLINAHLINPKTGEILKLFRFKKNFSEINFIYSQIAQEVAENLDAMLHTSEKKRLQQISNVHPEVYQLCLQGRYAALKLNHKEVYEAINIYKQALQIEPEYPPALAGLASCYIFLGYLHAIGAPEGLKKTMPLLEKALQLNPNLAFAHSNLGLAKMWFQWDFKGAEKAFIIGNELDPSDAFCIQGIVFLYIYTGKIEKAEFWRDNGLAIVPNDMWLNHFYGLLLFFKNQISESIAVFKNCTVQYAHILNYGRLGWAYLMVHEYEAAIEILEKALNKFRIRRPAILASLAAAYYQNKNMAKATELFSELESNAAAGSPNNAFYTAAAYAFIGKKEDAFRLLNRSYEVHDLDMLWLKNEPMLESIKDDPRYQRMLKKVGFD